MRAYPEAAGSHRFSGSVTILLAEGDRTGVRFAEVWGEDSRIAAFATSSHTFLDDPAARAWLIERLGEATASRH